MKAVPTATPIEAVYREHGGRLWRSVMAFSGDPEIASDAVAEAFAQLLRRGTAVHDPLPWVWRTAFRLAAGMLKDRSRSLTDPPKTTYDLPEPHYALLAALRQLSARQRGAVILHYYADRPISEVARILGSSTPAVKVNLMRARRRLRELLEEEDA